GAGGGGLEARPLGVEVADAPVRLLSAGDSEARLDNRFALLAKGDRTAPPRHRTLRAVLDWSYALLDEPEQRLLTGLALYVGGCSLDVAGEGAPFPAGPQPGTLPLLARLVAKSPPVSPPPPSRRPPPVLDTPRP